MNILVVLVPITIVWVILAGVVADLADRKGHSGTLWYVFSLAFSPLLGYMIVALLPSASELKPVLLQRCPECGNMMEAAAEVCSRCHRKVAPVEKSHKAVA